MILLRCSFLCLISTLFILNCEAGRGFSSRGGGSRSSSSGGWGSSSRSKPSSSSGSSWFSSKPKPAPSPSYSRPAPSPSYGWNVQSPSPSISRPSSVSSPASLSYPRQPAYNPSYTVPKPSITAPKPNVYKPPVSVSKPVASAPPSSGSYPKQPGSTWTAQKPVGPPPAYPGLGGGSHANVNPPAYSRYTPRNQAPAYTPQRPNPPPYTPAVSQGVKPYSSVNSGSYPKQTYTAVPAGQATQYGYPRQQYGTTNQGYGSYGQSYGGGYGGHAAPAPVYNHYGGSVGYGYPSHGTGPTIINNHYGGGGGYGGGYGGFGGGYGGYGGGYGGGSSGSGIGSHLLTAGLFYGLGRVTSPSSYGYGYSGLGGSGYRSSSTTTNTHNTYNNYYDHGSTTTSTVLPPLQVVTDTNNQSPVLLAAQPQPTQNQGQSPTDIYLSQPKDPYGVIIPSNSTSSNENKQEPTVIIPRTVDLTKQKIFEPVEIPWDQVSKHKLVEYPLWLNESVVRLPAYGYNFPTWNETTVISAPLTAVKAPVNAANAPVTTTPKPLEEPTGLGAKIGKLFYNVANWFSSGYKNDKSSEKTPQVYLDDETHGRPEAEMLRKVDEEKKPISTVIDDALARARADVEKFNK